ncbi:MAG: MarR family winged helix-turn-helix transcriptional regulator [Marmoricola sp.]
MAGPTRRARAPRGVPALATELTLLARHHLRTTHSPEHVLDRSAYQLLSRLEQGPLTQRGLAEAFGLDLSTVNRQVAALCRKGLVERLPDPDGGTARLLRGTDRGLALLRADRDVLHAELGRIVADWEGSDVEALRALLERFNMAIEHLEGRPWPRG